MSPWPVPGHRRGMRSRIARLSALTVAGVFLSGCGGPAPTPAVSPSPADVAVVSPNPSPSPTPLPSPSPTPTPTMSYADLDGLLVDTALAHRLPVAVPIDDNRIARPQSGFNGASIVYQAPADGGETRYMMVFQEGESRDIGPVRSGRIYFVQWAAEYRAALGHYGGDRQTLAWIADASSGLITNVDALAGSAGAFHRISSRKAPHNAYTSTKDLRLMAGAKGGAETIDAAIHRRPFVDAAPRSERAAKQSIRIPYSTGVVTYAFDRSTDRYLRSLDGKAQVDPADGQRVAPTNVVVLFQSFRIDTKIEPGHARPVIGSIGVGTAWVFREGRLTKGTWAKADESATTLLLDASGQEIPLVRGQTFIQIVPVGTKVAVSG